MERQTGISVGHEDLRAVGDFAITTALGGLRLRSSRHATVTNVPAEYN